MRLLFVMVADVPAQDVSAFREYEELVLPLLRRHGGVLERRLRTPDGSSEVHVVSFGEQAGYESYLADPERLRHREVLAGADVVQRLLRVVDVAP